MYASNVENQCLVVFYHSREWWLICGGAMEMELVCEGLKFLGFALHSFMFSLCVHVVGTNDGVKLLEVGDKRRQPFKAKALLHYYVFRVFSSKIVFVVVALQGKMPKM
jgi:hypothetical protein